MVDEFGIDKSVIARAEKRKRAVERISEFPEFVRSLYPGKMFKAKLMIKEDYTSLSTPRPILNVVFTFKKIYPHVALVTCVYAKKRYECCVNLKELYLYGQSTEMQIVREI